jgi:ribosome biogenesis protein Nip4
MPLLEPPPIPPRAKDRGTARARLSKTARDIISIVLFFMVQSSFNKSYTGLFTRLVMHVLFLLRRTCGKKVYIKNKGGPQPGNGKPFMLYFV